MTRLPAEWEVQAFVQFTFPHRDSDWASRFDEVVPCFVQIIKQVARFEPVLVVCQNVAEVKALFSEATAHRIHFYEAPSNDTWARDHGAITVLEQGRAKLLDFTFNGWGNKFEASLDNAISRVLHGAGAFARSRLQSMEFVLEGGAIESDGQGTLLTTSACLLSPQRNPHMSKKQIEAFLTGQFGLSRMLWLDHGYLAGDDTDSHIDTLARFCSPDTIAYVKCPDQSDEHFSALQQMELQLRGFRQADGDPYHLIALPWPEACFDENGWRLPATYANFLIINGAVLVPTYGGSQDAEALAVMQQCFPEHAIIGVNCRPLIEQHGSLHCITMQYPEQVTRIIP